MAKRKSHKKKTHRRRRVGALALNPSSTLVQLGSVAAGFFGADKFVNPIIDKVAGTMDAKLVSGVQIGLGTALVLGKLGKKSLLTVGLGGVLAGAGLKRGLRSFGVITGYQAMPVIGGRGVRGYGQMPVIGAYSPNESLNGYRTAPVTMNGAHKVMGNTNSGSGISTGSNCMG